MSDFDIPDVVLLPRARGSAGSDRKMHLPDPDDPNDSVCRYSGDFQPRSHAGLRDHFGWCGYCAERLSDSDGEDTR